MQLLVHLFSNFNRLFNLSTIVWHSILLENSGHSSNRKAQLQMNIFTVPFINHGLVICFFCDSLANFFNMGEYKRH